MAFTRRPSGDSWGEEQTRPHLNALTGLRFFAAFAVVLQHYGEAFPFPSLLQPLSVQGGAGVSFFYVLSGFVLAYNYNELFQTDCRRFGQFARARFARIVPAHVFCLLLVTPLVLYRFSVHLDDAPGGDVLVTSWLLNLFLLQAYIPTPQMTIWNGPSWSVSDEAFFYVIFPIFALYVLKRVRLPRIATLFIVVFCIGQLIITAITLGAAILAQPVLGESGSVIVAALPFFSPVYRIGEFFIGGVTATLFLQLREHPPSGLTTQLFTSNIFRSKAMFLSLIVVGLLIFFPLLKIVNYSPTYAPLSAAIIFIAAAGPTALSRLLENRYVILLRESSYSLYLVHLTVLRTFRTWLVDAEVSYPGLTDDSLQLLLKACVVLFTLMLSVAIYQFIERPARKRLRGRPAGLTSVAEP